MSVSERMALRVGVDATCWLLPRGFGRHARCLLSALLEVDSRNRYVFFTDSHESAASFPPAAEVRIVGTSEPTIVGASARGRRRIADLARMSRALSHEALDVLVFPTVYSYVPVLTRAKKLVIIHDVTAETFPELTLHNRAARWFWNAKVALGRWQADTLITVSEYSRTGIVEKFGPAVGDVHVLGEASDPAFRVLEQPSPTPFLLECGINGARRTVVYVGGFSPHKNLHQLVEVFARIIRRDGFDDVDLVFVGDYEDEAFFTCFESVRRLTEELDLEHRVMFTGFMPDDDLVVLLNLASVLVLPSLTEGFGLPAIEAAACGCPVVATRASPLPELLGEGGLFVAPTEPAELECALLEVLASEEVQRRMGLAGAAAAAELDWNSVARRLVSLIESVAAP